ncbi:hypothetical protein EYF80_006584 [Liparis tanakae]|uniref:Uncharacterized protein n=1 Tax=Liparis tanakae TaxID=230148 RepID=A0A4Z2IZX9_9TELE|nr:hypothetical protein EYF80_006584 [Liparis tanakae]
MLTDQSVKTRSPSAAARETTPDAIVREKPGNGAREHTAYPQTQTYFHYITGCTQDGRNRLELEPGWRGVRRHNVASSSFTDEQKNRREDGEAAARQGRKEEIVRGKEEDGMDRMGWGGKARPARTGRDGTRRDRERLSVHHFNEGAAEANTLGESSVAFPHYTQVTRATSGSSDIGHPQGVLFSKPRETQDAISASHSQHAIQQHRLKARIITPGIPYVTPVVYLRVIWTQTASMKASNLDAAHGRFEQSHMEAWSRWDDGAPADLGPARLIDPSQPSVSHGGDHLPLHRYAARHALRSVRSTQTVSPW